MRHKYDFLPELAPILIAAFFGLILWLFAVDGLAHEPLIADYLDPCPELCGQPTYSMREHAYRDEQRRLQRRQLQRLEELEMRAIRQEMRDFQHRALGR